MDVKQQFNLIAKEYDKNRKKFIPCFDDFYIETTKFIAANLEYPKNILDLGAGTGLLSYFWYQHFPKSKYVLIDIADEMLEVAHRRFSGLTNIVCESLDYSKGLPKEKFDIIISALSIHHLQNNKKQELFSSIYNKLNDHGVFINYDQFCADTSGMDVWFNSYWEQYLEGNELSAEDLGLWKERRKLDKECSVRDEMLMIQKSNFRETHCIYSCQKFSVIAALK